MRKNNNFIWRGLMLDTSRHSGFFEGENKFGGSVSGFKFCGHNFLYDLNIALGEIDRSIRSFSRT